MSKLQKRLQRSARPSPQSTAFEHPSVTRARLASTDPGEFLFVDNADYVSFTAAAVRRSSLKFGSLAKAGDMSGSTVSNLASGKTHYPRFKTIAGILGALGYETVIRGGKK